MSGASHAPARPALSARPDSIAEETLRFITRILPAIRLVVRADLALRGATLDDSQLASSSVSGLLAATVRGSRWCL